jgi:hypothetical protein
MTGSLGLPKNDLGADNSIEQACAPDSKQMRLLGYSIADIWLASQSVLSKACIVVGPANNSIRTARTNEPGG